MHQTDRQIEMTNKPQTSKEAAEKMVKNIRRKPRHTHSAKEKVHIILAGLGGEGHRGAVPFHPQARGKIKRWHQTMKNRFC